MSGRWRPIGHPFQTLFNPTESCTLVSEWGRTGFRRNLACYPWYVDAKAGDIVVSERDNHRLQVFDFLGGETRFQPQGCYGHQKNQFSRPGGITTTSMPGINLICADTGNRRVVFMKIQSDHYGNGLFDSHLTFGHQAFDEPMGLEHDVNRHYLVVTDTAKRRVTLHDMRVGTIVGEMRQPYSDPLYMPTDVAIDDMSRTYVADAGTGCIHIYDKNGDFIKVFGKGELRKPWGICFDRQENLLVSDEANGRILMYTPAGKLNRVITEDIYLPKGISVNIHERLVVATGDPYNFLKILQYK